MKYAKVNGEELVKYPYTWGDLAEENPYTLYDSRFDLPEWYAQTEEGISSGNDIVEVTVQDPPEIDDATQKIIFDKLKQPSFENGVWVIAYDVVEKTQEEIDQTNHSSLESST